MKIRVDHAARGETFDDAQLLNPEQDQGRPDIIEKLDSNKQNPERDSVALTLSRKRHTVMPDKHFPISSRFVAALAAASAWFLTTPIVSRFCFPRRLWLSILTFRWQTE
jgi:hypothetical protein